jgi:hypothetical protein
VPRSDWSRAQRGFPCPSVGAACACNASDLRRHILSRHKLRQGETLYSPLVSVSWRLSSPVSSLPELAHFGCRLHCSLNFQQASALPPHTVCVHIDAAAATSSFAACDDGAGAGRGSVSLLLTHPGVNIITGVCPSTESMCQTWFTFSLFFSATVFG